MSTFRTQLELVWIGSVNKKIQKTSTLCLGEYFSWVMATWIILEWHKTPAWLNRLSVQLCDPLVETRILCVTHDGMKFGLLFLQQAGFVLWKMGWKFDLKGNYCWRYTHFSQTNYDCGRSLVNPKSSKREKTATNFLFKDREARLGIWWRTSITHLTMSMFLFGKGQVPSRWHLGECDFLNKIRFRCDPCWKGSNNDCQVHLESFPL